MAAIKNVKYLNKECIYQYFNNPNEAFLEGFIVDENPIFCPRNCESGVYIKIFKVPVNSRVNEIYMQEFRWEAWKNGYNTPLPSDYSNNFKKAGYSIDSTRFWSLPNYLISVCPKLKAELIDYHQKFEQAYCKKIIEELSFCHALSDGKETNERAEQYAIYTMLEGRPVHYNFLLLNAQSIVRNINYKSIVNYIIDEDGYLGGAMETLKDYVLRSLALQGTWYSRRAEQHRQTPRLYLVGRVFHGHCDAVRDAQQRPEQSGRCMHRARQQNPVAGIQRYADWLRRRYHALGQGRK